MNGLLLVAATAAFLVAPNLAIDCSNNRCTTRGATHTMCKYPNTKPAPACGPVSSVGFTDAEKTEIINKHNELRGNVNKGVELQGNPGPQYGAHSMNSVSWDDELAEVAQRWANQCNFEHDECRDVDRFDVGQNVGYVWSPREVIAIPEDIIMTWYSQVKNMNANLAWNVTAEQINSAGQYTQIVWHNTVNVGCGKIAYRADNKKYYLMVCNYGPAGNRVGERVYVVRYSL